MDKLKLEHHVKVLEDKHKTLNKTIDTLEKIGTYSDFQMEIMKKQRLQLKDQIEHYKKQL
jgi:uncharacterized protein YdcH (DUF465 family)